MQNVSAQLVAATGGRGGTCHLEDAQVEGDDGNGHRKTDLRDVQVRSHHLPAQGDE